jgi:hypothetical protein
LARAVPGDFPASVDVDDRRPISGPFRILGSFASSKDAGMFQQNHGVWAFSGCNFGMNFPLESPSFLITYEIRVKPGYQEIRCRW